MAHFAEIDANNIVTRVIVVPNEEEEANGAAWCNSLFGGTWIQTSYNSRIRKNFAGIGYTYDAARDAFIPPQPTPTCVLNEETCLWEDPTPDNEQLTS